MPRKTEELVGEFDYIKFQYAAAEGQIKVMPAVLADGTAVIGTVDEDFFEQGLTYLFSGHWAEHPKYGPQFTFTSVGIAQPKGEHGTRSYLMQIDGIGRARAAKIWDLFGADSLRTCREQPEVIAEQIGIPIEAAQHVADYLTAHLQTEELNRALLEFGLSGRQVKWAIRQWGDAGPARIRDNAFILMECPGIGFLRADRLFLDSGATANRPSGWPGARGTNCTATAKDRPGNQPVLALRPCGRAWRTSISIRTWASTTASRPGSSTAA